MISANLVCIRLYELLIWPCIYVQYNDGPQTRMQSLVLILVWHQKYCIPLSSFSVVVLSSLAGYSDMNKITRLWMMDLVDYFPPSALSWHHSQLFVFPLISNDNRLAVSLLNVLSESNNYLSLKHLRDKEYNYRIQNQGSVSMIHLIHLLLQAVNAVLWL